MSHWPWPKIVAALAFLFVFSSGAGYAVGAQVNSDGSSVIAVAPTTAATIALTEAPTIASPSTEVPPTDAPSTLAPPTTAPTPDVPTTIATTTTEAGPRRPDRDHPLRVVMAGDSVMAGLAPPIKAALEADGTTVVRFLLTPSLLRDPTVRFTWNQQLADFNPQVIVMFVGTWESGAIAGTGGLTVDSPGWKSSYEQNVLDPWIQFITSRGASVLWLGNPIVNGDAANHLFDRLNSAFRDLPSRWPSVSYLETNPALNGVAPGYHDILTMANGTLVRTRQLDGLHLCAGGAALLGTVVSGFIANGFKATVRPDWESGAWRAELVYPPASCPNP